MQYIDEEEECRKQLAKALATGYAAWRKQERNKIAEKVKKVPKARDKQKLCEKCKRNTRCEEAELNAGVVEAKRIAGWNPYNQNEKADFFDAEWMFGVSVKDGFDIAIGNPPYIRHHKIHNIKPALKIQFGSFFTGMADISVYFYKRAAELLRDNGILTYYICTNKFMRSGYGKNLRQFLKTDMSLKIILDFGKCFCFLMLQWILVLPLLKSALRLQTKLHLLQRSE